MPTSPRPSSSRREMPIFTYSGVSPLRAGISPVDSSLLRCCSGHRVPPDTQWLISTRGLKGWNPENQQKDDESRCFLEEIPPHKECAVHGRLASTSPGGKSSEAAVSNFKAFPLKLPSPGSRAHPCLSDFLRLSPSVFSPALPPSSPTRVPVSLDRAPGRHFFLVPPLAPFSHPFTCFGVHKGGGNTFPSTQLLFVFYFAIKSPTFCPFSHIRCSSTI